MQPNPDLIAENMLGWARMAKQMPRSFDAAGITYAMASDESMFGKLLPGRGFMPAVDLKSLGIHRQPPGVYDPSRYRRLEDEARRRMAVIGVTEGGREVALIQGAAISGYDQIIAARGSGGGNDYAVTKTSMTTTANVWYDLFQQAGQPGAGTPLATTAPTDQISTLTRTGSLSAYLSNPTGSNKKYLLTFGFTAAQQINMAVLVDVVNDGGSFRMSVNTAETVTTPTNATRQYGSGSGIGNLLTFIVRTAGTPGAGTFTAQYIDQGAVATNAPALTTAAAAVIVGAIFPSSVGVTAGAGSFFVPLDPADNGVQAVKQTTCSVAGTGTLYSQVFFPLLFCPGIAANAYMEATQSQRLDGIKELANAAAVIGQLSLYILPNGTTTGALTGYVETCQG